MPNVCTWPVTAPESTPLLPPSRDGSGRMNSICPGNPPFCTMPCPLHTDHWPRSLPGAAGMPRESHPHCLPTTQMVCISRSCSVPFCLHSFQMSLECRQQRMNEWGNQDPSPCLNLTQASALSPGGAPHLSHVGESTPEPEAFDLHKPHCHSELICPLDLGCGGSVSPTCAVGSYNR